MSEPKIENPDSHLSPGPEPGIELDEGGALEAAAKKAAVEHVVKLWGGYHTVSGIDFAKLVAGSAISSYQRHLASQGEPE